MYVQVLHLPRSERKTKGMPFGNMGSRVLGYPKQREKVATNGNGTKGRSPDPIEMDYVTLHEGINQISATEWEAAIAHPSNNTEIKRLISQGIISVFVPAENKQGRSTADFVDFDDVVEIVNNCKDVNWLTYSLQVDTRQSEADGGDVHQVIRDRLKELEELAGVVRGSRLSMR